MVWKPVTLINIKAYGGGWDDKMGGIPDSSLTLSGVDSNAQYVINGSTYYQLLPGKAQAKVTFVLPSGADEFYNDDFEKGLVQGKELHVTITVSNCWVSPGADPRCSSASHDATIHIFAPPPTPNLSHSENDVFVPQGDHTEHDIYGGLSLG